MSTAQMPKYSYRRRPDNTPLIRGETPLTQVILLRRQFLFLAELQKSILRRRRKLTQAQPAFPRDEHFYALGDQLVMEVQALHSSLVQLTLDLVNLTLEIQEHVDIFRRFYKYMPWRVDEMFAELSSLKKAVCRATLDTWKLEMYVEKGFRRGR